MGVKTILEEIFMKKFGILLAVVAIVAIGFAGCASTGGDAASDANQRYDVDLTLLKETKNPTAFESIYGVWEVPFPEFPVDIKQFKKVTMTAKAYDADGNDITAWTANAQVKLVMNFDEPWESAGPNVIFHELNVGYPGLGPMTMDAGVSTFFGAFETLPQGFIIQNSANEVKFIEITSLIFHNGNAAPPASAGDFTSSSLDPFTLKLEANFQYGNGWQGVLQNAALLGKKRVQKDEKYTLKVTYSVDRDLTAPIAVNIQNVATGGTWIALSFDQSEVREPIEGEPVDPNAGKGVGTEFLPISKAGEEVTKELTFTIKRNGGSGPGGNAVIFQETPGKPSSGVVNINFTEFVLTKVE